MYPSITNMCHQLSTEMEFNGPNQNEGQRSESRQNSQKWQSSIDVLKCISPGTTLQLLESNYPREYTDFMAEYREYNECMRMLHTGYFKRSADSYPENRKRESIPLSDILARSENGVRRRHKRYGMFNSRSLRELVSRDRSYDDTSSDSWEDSLNIETETIPEEVLEESLPSVLRKIYKKHQDVAVILVEPTHQDNTVTERPRRHRRRRRRHW